MLDLMTDKLRYPVRKWQTLIEAHVDLKTTDNYTLNWFHQEMLQSGACHSVLYQVRRKKREIMIDQATTRDLKGLVQKFTPEMMGRRLRKFLDVYIRKVQILKAPKFDLGKLTEVHGDYKISRWTMKRKLLGA